MPARSQDHDNKHGGGLDGTPHERLDPCCPNCGSAVDVEQVRVPDEDLGLLVCPDCGAELPWDTCPGIGLAKLEARACLTHVPEFGATVEDSTTVVRRTRS
jgi:hypothetical protein